ncbi:hypothetical protein PENSPDRAFT_651734 [Peniophora sp. CONT]|nr:hypothetical protein PENSPDRAFT_651734 [Peniophora sp. CONT]
MSPMSTPQWVLDLGIQYDTYEDIFNKGGCFDSINNETKPNSSTGLQTVGQECEKLLRASPATFLDETRALFRTRTRCGTNRELWKHVAALSFFFGFLDDKDGVTRSKLLVFQSLVDHGLYDVLLELLSEGDMFDEHPQYVQSLLYIIKAVADVATYELRLHKDYDRMAGQGGFQIVSVNSRLAQTLADMFCALWTRRELMVDGHRNDLFMERNASGMRYNMSDLVFNLQWSTILNNQGFHQAGFQAMRRILLYLWMREREENGLETELLLFILGETFTIEQAPRDEDTMVNFAIKFIQQDLCGCYEPAAIIERLAGTFRFRAEGIVSRMASRILWLAKIVLIQPCSFPHIGPSRVFEAIIAVIDEHAASTDVARIRWKARRYVLSIVVEIVAEASFAEGAEPLIRQGIVNLLARAAIDAAHSDISDTDAQTSWDIWLNVIEQYTRVGGALYLRHEAAPADTKQKRSLMRILERDVHHEWYPTLVALRAAPPSGQKADFLQGWLAFGKAMGLVESDEQASFEKEKKQFCSWRGCEYHTKKAPSTTRQCAGCGQVRYCSKACQQKDWKEGKHKDACKRLKDGPHVTRAPG